MTPEILRQLSFTPPLETTQENISNKLLELGARSWQTEQTSSAITEAFNLAAKSPADPIEAAPSASDEHEEL